jgi:hypothetical protein
MTPQDMKIHPKTKVSKKADAATKTTGWFIYPAVKIRLRWNKRGSDGKTNHCCRFIFCRLPDCADFFGNRRSRV